MIDTVHCSKKNFLLGLSGPMEEGKLGWIVKVIRASWAVFLSVRSWNDSQRSLYRHTFHLNSPGWVRGWGHELVKTGVLSDRWRNQDEFLMFYIIPVFTISLQVH